MNESLRDITLRVAIDLDLIWNGKPDQDNGLHTNQIETFATRLVEELGKQEPVAEVVGEKRGYSDWYNEVEFRHNILYPKGTKLYAAPVIPVGMVLVPEDRSSVSAARVCLGLPEGYQINLCMEKDAAWIELHYYFEHIALPDNTADSSLEEQVTYAIAAAKGEEK